MQKKKSGNTGSSENHNINALMSCWICKWQSLE